MLNFQQRRPPDWPPPLPLATQLRQGLSLTVNLIGKTGHLMSSVVLTGN